jgi:hypothetical protein
MKFKMAATAGLSLTLDHMGKYRNIFFSEAIALIEKYVAPLQTKKFYH